MSTDNGNNGQLSQVIDEEQLRAKFLKETERLLRERGNIGEDKLSAALQFMNYTFLESLDYSNQNKK